MTEKPFNDHQNELFELLVQTAGHFEINTPSDEYALTTLHEALVGLLVREDLNSIKNQLFSIEKSDIFFSDAVTPQMRTRLIQLVKNVTQANDQIEQRVFVRDVPVRTSQMKGSVPVWASGAAVEKTLGPFLNKDGRNIWFDFFSITKLVALYMDGLVNPALLFKVAQITKVNGRNSPVVLDNSNHFELVPESVWINSAILAKNAPDGCFTGLKIKGGAIKLNMPAHIINGKLTIPHATKVSVKLELDASSQSDADPDSAYGIDARNATLSLPEQLVFHFSANGGTVDAIDGNINLKVYGQSAKFNWQSTVVSKFDAILNRVLIPLNCSENEFTVFDCQSPFTTLQGRAEIQQTYWAVPAGKIDITKPSVAAGIGGLVIRLNQGLTTKWQGLKGGAIELRNPYLLCDPGRINITDLKAGSDFSSQEYSLWKDSVNRFGSTLKVQYTAIFPFVYNSFSNGNEAFLALVDTHPMLDRPVSVVGLPFDIHSKQSALLVAANQKNKLIYVYDDNILFDNYNPKQLKVILPEPLAVALQNALFKVTPVNGCLLFGTLADDMLHIETGRVFLTFGMYAYVPTLPDPYAANLNILKAQFGRLGANMDVSGGSGQKIGVWLVSQTQWKPISSDQDQVDVSFHFAPLQNQFQITPEQLDPFVQLLETQAPKKRVTLSETFTAVGLPDLQVDWDKSVAILQNDIFSLLDVSSNANQMGVSFAWFSGRQMEIKRTQIVQVDDTSGEAKLFPLQVHGLDVVAKGQFVRAFMLPQVSWEPVLNLTKKEKPGDPPFGPNYYADDGGASKIVNNSKKFVALAPIPLCDFLVNEYEQVPENVTSAYFTLPFGMRAFAQLSKMDTAQSQKPSIKLNMPLFKDGGLVGGIQFKLEAGSGINTDQSNTFKGFTLQINNVLNALGNKTDASTLGYDVSVIFNNDFFFERQAVPLTRMDMSGYGASIFSNWLNKGAQFASTSQASFDVFTGRTAHEVVQVRSIVYPWGIRVVRTVTLSRVGSGYVYRFDTGWKAESDGKFDFRFEYIDEDENKQTKMPYRIHPGTIKGLFNIQNIKTALSDVAPFLDTMAVNGFFVIDPKTDKIIPASNNEAAVSVNLQPVYFDADVELENIVLGQVAGKVSSKKILGFVQLAPRGIPLTPKTFHKLLERQMGSIGGSLDCVMDIGQSGQKFRINRFDVNSSVDVNGIDPVFVAAARGSVILPKDGSWSTVKHARATGEVTPLPEHAAAPLIRIGELNLDLKYPQNKLLRIANPADLLRKPCADTINFGFLQSTNTQKVLFLTPAFETHAHSTAPGKLLSKTPPLFVDAYRLVSSKAIFPNIADAETNFGSAIALTKGFGSNQLKSLTDDGKEVLELMHINSVDGQTLLKTEGYRLINTAFKFDLPKTPWYLINEDNLKIYVEYRATTQNKGNDPKSITDRDGELNFDVNSFADNVADRWKSRLNNIAMVVDLGPLERLVTIKGNFDAKKGSEASFVGTADPADPDFSAPQIEFSQSLNTVKELLQILEDLQGGNYADIVKSGLKIAMSNSADSWEYKFEASQEIPLIRFPPPPIYYESEVPLRLEASLKVGVYFNAALTTAAFSDPTKLLPTAGAYVDFYGRLSVMCFSLGAATVYAVGQVNLQMTADTKVGPSLDMKFGFGAQVVVGLPLVGNVSVLYMMGVEIHMGLKELSVSAFMLYQGQAELIAGLVSITISIEAKGTINRIGKSTSCEVQVTFAIDISIFLVIDIDFSKTWAEQRQIA